MKSRLGLRRIQSVILLILVLEIVYHPIGIIKGAAGSEYGFSLKWKNPDPYFIDVDESGNVYVAGRNTNLVQKYDSDGNLLATWGAPDLGRGSLTTQRE